MEITVSGKQIDLSDALRERVSHNLNGITGKYFEHAQDAKITFARSRLGFTCDINLHAGRGLILRGEAESTDAYTAFDKAAEHVGKRLRRYRRRVIITRGIWRTGRVPMWRSKSCCPPVMTNK